MAEHQHESLENAAAFAVIAGGSALILIILLIFLAGYDYRWHDEVNERIAAIETAVAPTPGATEGR